MRGAAFCLTMAIVLAVGWPMGHPASGQTKGEGSPVGKMPAPPTGKEITQQGDGGVVQRLAVNDLFDIASSRWLLERSRNPAVRTFANRVLKEHDGSLRKLTAVARTGKIDVTIPSSLDERMPTRNQWRSFTTVLPIAGIPA
jgi:predicted outer membrane protein